MDTKENLVLKVCRDCGREFLGWPTRVICTDCVDGKRPDDKDRELADERDGWRHMLRDATGTVIVPGGNVMTALDALCDYEEVCEAAGIHGPEALKRELEKLRKGTGARIATGRPGPRNDSGGKAWTGDVEYDPHAQRKRRTGGLHCENCGHYHPTVASGGKGICDHHPRRIRPEGGRGGKYVVLDEPRQCQARRVACGDWVDRQQGTGDGGGGFLGSARNDGTGDGGRGFLGSARNDGTGDAGHPSTACGGPPPLRAGEVWTGDADCRGLRPRNDIKEGDHHA